MLENNRLIIHWRELAPYDALWVVRGLDQDGKYYGELIASTLPQASRGTQKSGLGFSGRIQSTEAANVFLAADAIRGTPVAHVQGKRIGFLAEGEYSSPNVLYQQYLDNFSPTSSRHFDSIIAVFRPYFTLHLEELLKLVRDANGTDDLED